MRYLMIHTYISIYNQIKAIDISATSNFCGKNIQYLLF